MTKLIQRMTLGLALAVAAAMLVPSAAQSETRKECLNACIAQYNLLNLPDKLRTKQNLCQHTWCRQGCFSPVLKGRAANCPF